MRPYAHAHEHNVSMSFASQPAEIYTNSGRSSSADISTIIGATIVLAVLQLLLSLVSKENDQPATFCNLSAECKVDDQLIQLRKSAMSICLSIAFVTL